MAFSEPAIATKSVRHERITLKFDPHLSKFANDEEPTAAVEEESLGPFPSVPETQPGTSPIQTRDEEQVLPVDEKPAVPAYEDRAVPAYEDRAVPAYEDRAMPAYEHRAMPAYEHRAKRAHEDRAMPAYEDRAMPAYEDLMILREHLFVLITSGIVLFLIVVALVAGCCFYHGSFCRKLKRLCMKDGIFASDLEWELESVVIEPPLEEEPETAAFELESVVTEPPLFEEEEPETAALEGESAGLEEVLIFRDEKREEEQEKLQRDWFRSIYTTIFLDNERYDEMGDMEKDGLKEEFILREVKVEGGIGQVEGGIGQVREV
ncbi:uncharacterized protein LOC143934550 [Lithobates pipiens]